MNNHIWFGNTLTPHDVYLMVPQVQEEVHLPQLLGVREGKMTEKGKMMAPMVPVVQHDLFQIKKRRKQFKRKTCMKRKGIDSTLTSRELLKRF